VTVASSTLLGREEVAEGTVAVHLAKPQGFVFRPGQAIDVMLPGTDGVGDAHRHAFSIVTAPYQPGLTIATRMRDSAYKRALAALPVGSQLGIDGPFGSLTLHRDRKRPALFIAGGIGITPFVSMLRHATLDEPPRRLALLYANHRPEDAAFLDELQDLEKRLLEFRFLPTMTRMKESRVAWSGATTAIDAALVREACANMTAPICYVAGPPAMVSGARKVLIEAGIDDDEIRSEEFHGY